MKIFVDMDGVLCDFDKKCRSVFDINPNESSREYSKRIGTNKYWKKIRETENFWSSIEPISDSISMWEKLSKICGEDNITILSSPDKDPKCIEGKNEWINTHLGHNTKRIFDTNKKKYSKHGHLLIDDLEHQIEDWITGGGFGILCKGIFDDNFWKQVDDYIASS